MDIAVGIVQILFWVVVGTIGVLTYRQARKTVLQPLRTEVFKLQLERMSEVMALFVGRDLEKDAHFQKLFDANSWLLLDTYAAAFFPIEIDRKGRPYFGIRTYLMKTEHLELSESHVEKDPGEKEKVQAALRLKRQETWPKDPVFGIPIPDELIEYQERIRSILQSPLIPARCAELLEEYLVTIDKNTAIIGEVIEWAAPQLQERYPTLEEIKIARTEWMYAHWRKKMIRLDDQAARVTSFTRDYFRADEFAPASEK